MQDVALDANRRWIKCVLNAKFIVFHTNFRKYLNFGTLEKIRTSENIRKFFLSEFVFFKEFFLTKMFISDNFFQRIFHCFQDHYTVLK